nr:MAG TPA: hypothetical protein [Caudoviricetes sp.]
MKTIWRDACVETPDCYDEFKDKLFVVHTAPVIQGEVDFANGNYSVATWDKDNKTWKNVHEDNIVLEWTSFDRLW